MEVNPLSIILVKSDSKGDRLLFRYPFLALEKNEPANTKRKNPYTLPNGNAEDLLQSPPQPVSNIQKGHLTGFTDEVLSSLFAVKLELCNRKFELKVNDVRFVSHPTLLQLRSKKHDETFLLINIVFALQALANQSVVKCYHELSERIGIAVKHEEERCGFIEQQTISMALAHDDGYALNPGAAFETILEKCTLARNIKKMYEDLCSTGLVNILINRWIPLSFCLPQKVHQWHLNGKIIELEDIGRCLKALRPYHSILLLCQVQEMNNFISLDGSPTLIRMLNQYSPLKNLQTLAADTDLTLNHIFQLTAHLVYWAKATVIYPICSTNKYVISPDAPVHLCSPIVEQFSNAFPGMNLLRVMADFSLPTSLGQKCNPLFHPSQQSQLVKMIMWMLQHHLVLQLHTYIQFMPTANGRAASPKTQKIKDVIIPKIKFHKANNMSSGLQNSSDSRTESDSGTSTVSESLENPLDMKKEINNSKSDDKSFINIDDEKESYQEELLDFPEEERISIYKIPSASNPEDLSLFAKLCRKKYFQGQHHIEEIMYLENLRRSQLLQLLDKFRDVLITYETEDPAIAMFSHSA